jgi:hypothetical protein
MRVRRYKHVPWFASEGQRRFLYRVWRVGHEQHSNHRRRHYRQH